MLAVRVLIVTTKVRGTESRAGFVGRKEVDTCPVILLTHITSIVRLDTEIPVDIHITLHISIWPQKALMEVQGMLMLNMIL